MCLFKICVVYLVDVNLFVGVLEVVSDSLIVFILVGLKVCIE